MENTLTAAPSLPPRCRAPPGSWHGWYRCSGAPSVAQEPRPSPPGCCACLQAALPEPGQPYPAAAPTPGPASPWRWEAGALFLWSLQRALWEGSGGFPNNSCLSWRVGWVDNLGELPVGAAVAFGGNVLGRGAAAGRGGSTEVRGLQGDRPKPRRERGFIPPLPGSLSLCCKGFQLM